MEIPDTQECGKVRQCKKNMDSIQDIIEKYLKNNNYDGLCNVEFECGCIVGDLMPCSQLDINRCCPGHQELQDDGDWLVFPGKKIISKELK